VDQGSYNCLLDEIYETGVNPHLWVSVMERISDTIGGNSAWLSQLSVADGNGSGIGMRIDPEVPQRYIDYYVRLNPCVHRPQPMEYMARWKPRITTHEDFIERDDLIASEFYNDFLRPQNIDNVLMIDLAAHGLNISTVNIHRPKAKGPFDYADLELAQRLHPHLMRAFKIGSAFSEMEALSKDRAAALENSTYGVFVLDSRGTVRHANLVGERILAMDLGLSVVAGALVAARLESAKRLLTLIGQATSANPDVRQGGSMTLESGRGQLYISVAPLRAERMSIFTSGRSALVTVTDPHPSPALADGQLRILFGLTPAEIRVVRTLFGGATPVETASLLDISVNTVRWHLARIFEKTGVQGQVELSQLLMRLPTRGSSE
jgi:DNA-binding CsgD family transcriptional regulator